MPNAVQMIVGAPLVGGAFGFGYGVYNKRYGVGINGSNYNDPYVGYSDFVIHGAGLGGLAAAASAGLKFQSHQAKVAGQSEIERKFLAMIGQKPWYLE